MKNIRGYYLDLSILTFIQVQQVLDHLISINEVLFPYTLRRLTNRDNFLEVPSKNNSDYFFFDGNAWMGCGIGHLINYAPHLREASFEQFLNLTTKVSVVKLNNNKRIQVQVL